MQILIEGLIILKIKSIIKFLNCNISQIEIKFYVNYL